MSPFVAPAFGEVVGSRLQFSEQACVFDSDHGLVGESRHQLDLFWVNASGTLFATKVTPTTFPFRRSGTAKSGPVPAIF